MPISEKTKDICVVLINWNGWQDTIECVESLLSSQNKPAAIVIVDNGSTDDSLQKLQHWAQSSNKTIHLHNKQTTYSAEKTLAQLHLIQHKTNEGYGAGNNSGICWALAQDCFSFIWLLNNDTIVHENCLIENYHYAEHQDIDIVGATILYHDNPHIIQCAGGCFYAPLTTVPTPYLTHEILAEAKDRRHEPHFAYIYGASLFVRSTAFEQCGLLTEETFLFFEEIDFCQRCLAMGFTLGWSQKAEVKHKVSSSIGLVSKKNKTRSAFINYHENISSLIFTWRHYPLLLLPVMIIRLLGKSKRIIGHNDFHLTAPLLRAYYHFLRFHLFTPAKVKFPNRTNKP